ncbi:MAG: hypothetical protein L0287_23950, partial [Anaerolineae bacterium]|nr:hypothetical protein [Anaerolineae bacterium]
MAIKRMTEQEAIEYVNSHLSEIAPYSGEIFAVRGDDYIPAKKFRPSHVWEDGNKLSEKLPGVCASWFVVSDVYGDWEAVEEIPSMKDYGEYRFLLRGHKVDMDGTENDWWDGEVILS